MDNQPVAGALRQLIGHETTLVEEAVVGCALTIALQVPGAESRIIASGARVEKLAGDFKFTGSGYSFSVSTKGLSSGQHTLYFTAGADPHRYAASFTIR